MEIHRRSGEHQEALRRELAFIEHAHAADAAPARLQALSDELTGRYGALTETQTKQLLEAMEAGKATIDLEFELPPDIVDATVQLGALLEELDDFCREGDLLTLVTPPDLRAYRQLGARRVHQPDPRRAAAPPVDEPPRRDPRPPPRREDVRAGDGAASASRTTSTSPRRPPFDERCSIASTRAPPTSSSTCPAATSSTPPASACS